MIFMKSVRFNLPCSLFSVEVVSKLTEVSYAPYKNDLSLLPLPVPPLCISIYH